VANSIKAHWNWHCRLPGTRLTNGASEALNGIIQTAKRKSRGFKNFEYFRAVIYLVGSKLKFNLPSPVPTYPLTLSLRLAKLKQLPVGRNSSGASIHRAK
jgi:hypothetical protein